MTETLKSVGIDIGTSAPGNTVYFLGTPRSFHILDGSEFHLRAFCAALRMHGLAPAPLCGVPVVEVPI